MSRLPPATRLVPVVAGAALLAYAAALHGSFVNWDDRWLVVENEALRSFASVGAILDPSGERGRLGAEYLPLRDLSNLVDWQFFAAEPRGYRLGNWLLHALAAAAAFLFLLEGLRSRAAAFAGALLWAVHPLHAEAVAWASARKDVLNAVFAFTAAALYLRSGRTGSRAAYAAALAAFVAATLSKTTAAALPVALAAWEFLGGAREGLPAGRRFARAALRAAPFVGVAAAGAWVNSLHQADTWKAPQWHGGGWLENAFLVAGVNLRYLRQCVLPTGLGPVYASGAGDPAAPAHVAGVVLVLATLAALPLLARRSGAAAAAVLWWFLLLLPASSLLVPLLNLAADRYTFLPSLGPAALAGVAWAAWRERAPRAAWSVLAAAVAALAIASNLQARHWRDSEALWARAVEVSPRSGKAWQNHAAALATGGDRAGAIRAFRSMVDAEPWEGAWWTLTGMRLHDLGGPDLQAEVESLLRHAVARARPGNPGPLVALSAYLGRAGRPAEAREAMLLAAKRDPDHGEVRTGLGFLALADGDAARARAEFEAALRGSLPPGEERRVREALLALCERAGDAAGADRQREGLRRMDERRAPVGR